MWPALAGGCTQVAVVANLRTEVVLFDMTDPQEASIDLVNTAMQLSHS